MSNIGAKYNNLYSNKIIRKSVMPKDAIQDYRQHFSGGNRLHFYNGSLRHSLLSGDYYA